jgi:branched-chain amino acid transport system permease protein
MGSSLAVMGLMILASMVVCGIVGVLIEVMAYRPMRNQPRIAALITAIGVSLLLQYGGALFLPVSPPPVIREEANALPDTWKVWIQPPPEPLRSQHAKLEAAYEQALKDLRAEQHKLRTDSTTPERLQAKSDMLASAQAEYGKLEREVQPVSIRVILPHGLVVMMVTSFVLMLILRWLVMKTKVGRGMRAVAQDFDSAALMGVNVNTVVMSTFLIGSALAGAGAMMYATFQGLPITTFFGVPPGLKAFVAAVVGGIGNIPGAVLGGLLMGVAEALVIWSGMDAFKDAFAFVILIAVLLVKPKGLLGSNTVEKV